jgi:hypothetical protein
MRCNGCGADVPDEDGPTHRYLESAPGCWRIYTELLAREYTDREYYRVHRLSVDTYAVQHPGRKSPQTIQSATVHLARLYVLIERNWPIERANDVMTRFAGRDKSQMFWLDPPASRGNVTVADVARAAGAAQHAELVWKWARSAWEAWSPHHAQIRVWVDQYLR